MNSNSMATLARTTSSLTVSLRMFRTTVLSLLLSSAVSAEPVKHHPVSVRLEPVASEESVVNALLSFLGVKIDRYQVISNRPFASLHARVIFYEHDMSGKLVETDRLQSGCLFVAPVAASCRRN